MRAEPGLNLRCGLGEAGGLVSRNVGKQTAVGKLNPKQSQVPVSEVTAQGEEGSEQGGEKNNRGKV